MISDVLSVVWASLTGLAKNGGGAMLQSLLLVWITALSVYSMVIIRAISKLIRDISEHVIKLDTKFNKVEKKVTTLEADYKHVSKDLDTVVDSLIEKALKNRD